MNVIGLMRIKNESRWIKRCIESFFPICGRFLILDDHSDDGTPGLCAGLPNVTVYRSAFDGLNESRDKQWLLDKAMGLNPDWLCFTDGDEVLAHSGVEALREAMAGPHSCLSLRVLYLWDREDQVRTDGVYGDFHRESVFRPNGSRFQENGGANFHCGNVPWGARQDRQVLSDVHLLHMGYLHKEDRIRKYRFYTAADPGNEREGFYKHVVQGDIPEVPADARLTHGGPLQLSPIN